MPDARPVMSSVLAGTVPAVVLASSALLANGVSVSGVSSVIITGGGSVLGSFVLAAALPVGVLAGFMTWFAMSLVAREQLKSLAINDVQRLLDDSGG